MTTTTEPTYKELLSDNRAQGWTFQGSIYTVANQRLEFVNDPSLRLAYYEQEEFFNYSYIVDHLETAWGGPGNVLGIAFGIQDPSNFYRFEFGSNENPEVKLIKRENGTDTIVQAKTYSGPIQNTPLRAVVEHRDNKIGLRINDDPFLFKEVPAPTFSQGHVGVFARNTRGIFDSFRVRQDEVTTEPEVYVENFDDNAADNFSKQGNWYLANHNEGKAYFCDSQSLISQSIYEARSFGDVRVSANITNRWGGNGNKAGIYLGFQDPDNYYLVQFGSGADPDIELIEKKAGAETAIASNKISGNVQNKAQALAVTRKDNLVSVEVGGTLLIDKADAPLFADGKVGFLASNTRAIFDDFGTLDQPTLPDGTVPEPPAPEPEPEPEPPATGLQTWEKPFAAAAWNNRKIRAADEPLMRKVANGLTGGGSFKVEGVKMPNGKRLNDNEVVIAQLFFGEGGWGAKSPSDREIVDTSEGNNGAVEYEGKAVYLRIPKNYVYADAAGHTGHNDNGTAIVSWNKNDTANNCPKGDDRVVAELEVFNFVPGKLYNGKPYATCIPRGVRANQDLRASSPLQGAAGGSGVTVATAIRVGELTEPGRKIDHVIIITLPRMLCYTPPYVVEPARRIAGNGERSNYNGTDNRVQHGNRFCMKRADYEARNWETEPGRRIGLGLVECGGISINGVPSKRLQITGEESERGSVSQELRDHGIQLNSQGTIKGGDQHNAITEAFKRDIRYIDSHLYALPNNYNV